MTTAADHQDRTVFNRGQIGLGLNAGVTLVMVVAPVLAHTCGAEAKSKA